MKKSALQKYILSFYIVSAMVSCLSKPPATDNSYPVQNTETITEEALIIPDESIKQEETAVQEEQKTIDTSLAAYESLVSSLQLSPSTLPSPSIKGSTFKKPFIIKVTNTDNSPAVHIPITVEYPSSNSEGIIVFTTAQLISNEEGYVEFMSPKTDFSCNSVISFYPSPKELIPELKSIIQRVSLKIPYLVKTNLTSAGGAICLVDFDKQGNAITNNGLSSSALLGNLIRNGFSKIGNAEFYKEVASSDYNRLISEAKELFGTASSYFIVGTVKYAQMSETAEDGSVTVKLSAEITCIDMITSNTLYTTNVEVKGTGKTEQSALNSARNEQLAPLLAEKIMYGM